MLLVSNDFPPKVGGIQNYLYELWSRLPLTGTKVITTKYPGAQDFDREQDFDIERYSKILWPTPKLVSHVNRTISELNSDVVFIDPLLPTGLITSKIKNATRVMIIHGAEITVPGRIFATKPLVKKSMASCDIVLSAGNYAARELVRSIGCPINMVRIPPGVDTQMFYVPSSEEKEKARTQLREELSIDKNSKIIVSTSRLVPRKGFDTSISALSGLDKDVHLVIIGKGRDRKRLEGIVADKKLEDRVHFLGSISLSKLINTYHGSDLFLMPCRDRWGSLEAEGFGIVFLEAQACGLPVIAGRSGGTDEALIDGVTGIIVDPGSLSSVRNAITEIITNEEKAISFASKGREFVEKNNSYDYLATLLFPLVEGDFSSAKKFEG
ncbi:MAG: glycosyltransferase family 4 protein [Acidimicrobiia bacterium]